MADNKTLCPYYKGETGARIICKGIITDVCENTFVNVGLKNKYKNRYCKGLYLKCNHTTALHE